LPDANPFFETAILTKRVCELASSVGQGSPV